MARFARPLLVCETDASKNIGVVGDVVLRSTGSHPDPKATSRVLRRFMLILLQILFLGILGVGQACAPKNVG